MKFSLGVIAAAIGAEARGVDALAVRGYSIDSRTVSPGDLFFAIHGEHFDGHNFLPQAFERGAVASVVSQSADGPLLLRVPDTLVALQQLAHWARRQWRKPIAAVTGSAGKTSTKDIIAELLSVRLRVGKTIGNLNNHLGLPLTVLRLPHDAEVAIVEMGMNHAGEIRALAKIAEPQIGVVTNVGYAHIEAFDSIDGVAAAKRELIEELPADGVAVLNADDERVSRFRQAHRGRTVTYGFSSSADVCAEAFETNAQGSAFRVRGVSFYTKLSGRHTVSNILAGIAVADLFQIPPRELVDSVAQLAPGKMRGERGERRGITVLNDAYNSNPEAARRMIDVLMGEPAERRIAVMGEMLELGRWAEALHRDLGRYAAERGVDVLIGVSGASRLMVEEAKTAGLGNHTAVCSRAAFFFDDPESAGDFLRSFARPGDAVLFKGSRGTHIETALARMEG